MDNTFTQLALHLVASPHLLERKKISNVMIELLETTELEQHPIEILLRGQMIALIQSCSHYAHSANAHSLLEIVDFYDRHFIVLKTELALAA